MINPRDIEIRDYDYDLPDERIAKYPLNQRDHSKLLVFGRELDHEGQPLIEQHHFCDLPSMVPAGSMIVFNNTKVIQARLHFRKPTGGVVEVFCLEPESPKDYQQNFAAEHECWWTCLVGNSKKWKEGSLSLTVTMADGRVVTLYCERAGELGPSQLIHFYWDQPGCGAEAVSFAQLLDAMGELPIPPYLNRATEESDKETYQTVYSRIQGSVAAPTAGLHYTPEVLSALQQRDVNLQYLTLHVGAGTFKPVKSETIEGHDMHTEFISVPKAVIASIVSFLQSREAVSSTPDAAKQMPLGQGTEGVSSPLLIATGTTSVRTLESLYYIGEKLVRLEADDSTLLNTHSSLLNTHSSLPNTHSTLLNTHSSLLNTHSTLLNTHSSLLSTITAEDLIVHQWEPYDTEHTLPTLDALRAILAYLDRTGKDTLVTATQILIAPGFQYRLVDAVVTNFHMPQSTLLLLVSALTDGDNLRGDNWHRIYKYAMEHDFRFLSYGDSSLLFRRR